MSTTIDIDNIGAIRHLSIPIPPEGGLVVLRGPNGIGKSTALDAVGKLTDGQGTVERNWNTTATGRVSGLGVTLGVSARTSRKGELEIESLADRISIAQFVDPGIADPVAADSRRIRSLLALTGRKPDATAFHELAGGAERFGSVVDRASAQCADLIEMAVRIKRCFESAARDAEDRVGIDAGKLTFAQQSIGGVDLSAPSDEAELRRACDAAIERRASLRTSQREAAESVARMRDAQARLEQLRAAHKGKSQKDAASDLAAAEKQRDKAKARAAELRAQLAAAEKALASAESDVQRADSALEDAIGHDAAIDALERTIADGQRDPVSDCEIQAAEKAVEEAERAIVCGHDVRRAASVKAGIEQLEWNIESSRKSAEHWRAAAAGVDGVLSAMVNVGGMSVVEGRLTIARGTRRQLFSKLSVGERYSIGVDVAADHLGEGGLMVLPQEAFDGLDPANRKTIADKARARKIVILTAEADSGDLRAEALN